MPDNLTITSVSMTPRKCLEIVTTITEITSKSININIDISVEDINKLKNKDISKKAPHKLDIYELVQEILTQLWKASISQSQPDRGPNQK